MTPRRSCHFWHLPAYPNSTPNGTTPVEVVPVQIELALHSHRHHTDGMEQLQQGQSLTPALMALQQMAGTNWPSSFQRWRQL